MHTEYLQSMLREIGMDTALPTGLRSGLSALGKMGWETWLEERSAKLAARRIRVRSQLAQQISGLVQSRSDLSSTMHQAELQEVRQAYELEQARSDPQAFFASRSPQLSLPASPTRALPPASAPPPAITDEQIDALALRALLGFQTERWGNREWMAFADELAQKFPENVVREVQRRVGEMARELN